MWVKSLQLKHIKSFQDAEPIVFSKGINLLVGPNNAGKSTILRAAYSIQGFENPVSGNVHDFLTRYIRFGHQTAEIRIVLEEPNPKFFQIPEPQILFGAPVAFEFLYKGGQFQASYVINKGQAQKNHVHTANICRQREPDNFIHPFFARRRPPAFDLSINETNQNLIEEVFSHIPAKLDKFNNQRTKGFKEFQDICVKCLGLDISTAVHVNGKQAGFVRSDGKMIPMDQMGDGTFSVISLLAHLCGSEGKLFIIEEIENDIHPKALKVLLEFIVNKSYDNQFILSTHSNIVLSCLGGSPGATIHEVCMNMDTLEQVPLSTCVKLDANPETRQRLLEHLGYQPSDLYFYDAYIVFEESTAERIIRDFFIPQMFPKLMGKLRTIAAGGVSNVESYFQDFLRLFVYLHTAEPYHDRAWIAVDGDFEGQQLVERLRLKFNTRKPNSFRFFCKSKFEEYYPPIFAIDVSKVLAIEDKRLKQKEKGILVERVLAWCTANPQDAIQHFKAVAQDVIALLKEIEETLSADRTAEQR